MKNPFRYFDSSPEVIRLVVQMYVRHPLSLRNVEDLLAERGIDICYETVRLWWNRFGPMFAAEIRRKRVDSMRGCTHWRSHLDEVYVKINVKSRPTVAPPRIDHLFDLACEFTASWGQSWTRKVTPLRPALHSSISEVGVIWGGFTVGRNFTVMSPVVRIGPRTWAWRRFCRSRSRTSRPNVRSAASGRSAGAELPRYLQGSCARWLGDLDSHPWPAAELGQGGLEPVRQSVACG
jgi:hypothetical protein